ncbi:CobW family GTP-binding protein [Inquilinus sp.]|jgi:G3E family GTPase|uniref:CobW family GTP-binding protein n=1 Tax=Inquilinus sp. TaxID=1932117 RepID=UPI0037852E8A
MARAEPIPLLLLTGFLGSGKTTLLRRWLAEPAFAGTMVVVNELGEVGFDHALLASSTDAPVLVGNGCACCTASEDLAGTLERLFWDRLHRRIPRFERIVVETTGIAEPGPILERIASGGIVAERYRAAGVVVTVDAGMGEEQIASFPEARHQLDAADIVVLTKADRAGPAEASLQSNRLAEMWPGVPVLVSHQADVPAAAILAALDRGEAHRPHHDRHGHHHHEPSVSSAFLPLPAPVDAARLAAVLDRFANDWRGRLVRAKGLVQAATGFATVQMAGDGVVAVEPLPAPGPDAPHLGLTVMARGGEAVLAARDLAARLRADDGIS